MPVLDGVQATKRIRAHLASPGTGCTIAPPSTLPAAARGPIQPPKIVALSASLAGSEDMPEGSEKLFDSWLTKPVTQETMRDTLERYLAARHHGSNNNIGIEQ